MRVYLIELAPYDPVAEDAVTLRVSSVDDVRACLVDNKMWVPAVARLPALTMDLFDGSLSGQTRPGAGQLAIDLSAFPQAGRYNWSDKRARIWHGRLGDAWGDFALLFDGLTTGAAIAEGRIQLSLRVNDSWLDRPLLSLSYAGTGGAEGPAALKGSPKPLAIGWPKFASGVEIDHDNLIFQLHGYGEIEGSVQAHDRLVRFGAPAGDSASYAALVSAGVPAGTVRTSEAAGLIRHGAPLVGKQSYSFKGDAAGPDGWVRTPGAVIKRLALIAGATLDQLDLTSLAALDAAAPYTMSIYVDQQTTVGQMIRAIAAQCNAAAGVSWTGKLFVCRASLAGTAALTLRMDGSSLPPVASVEQLEVGAPFHRMQMLAAPTWSVHDFGDIASAVTYAPLGDYDAGKVYSEGNIVRQPSDGKQYNYINPTPTAGNAPPNGTYWEVWEAAPSAGTLTGSVDFATQVGGAGKPEAGATVGADVATNLKSGGAPLAPDQVLNDDLRVTATSGQIFVFRQSPGGPVSIDAVNLDDAGIAALAYLNDVDYDSLVTGTGKPELFATRSTSADEVNRNPFLEEWTAGVAVGWEVITGSASQQFGSAMAENGATVARMLGNSFLLGEAFPVYPGETLILGGGFGTVTNDTVSGDNVGRWSLGITYSNNYIAPGSAGADNYYPLVPFNTGFASGAGRQNKIQLETVPLSGSDGPPRYAKLIALFEYADTASNAVGDLDYYVVARRQGTSPFMNPATNRASSRRFNSQFSGSGIDRLMSANPLSAATSGGIATITVNAIDEIDDAGTLSFSLGSIGGLNPNALYHVGEINPDYVGGARSFQAFTGRTSLATAGLRFVASIVTPPNGDPPTSGTGGTGGAWSGGGQIP